MFWALLTTSILAAAPQPPAIAITRFRLVQVDPSLGGYAEDRLAAKLAARGFQVTTPADLEAVLGLERQRQLLGCSDDTSCLAEISSALGVPYVATGRITRLGRRFELDVRVIRQKDGVVAASDNRGTDDEALLGELLQQASDALANQLLPRAPTTPFRWRLWVPLVAGAAVLVSGAVLIGTAERDYASFTTPGSTAAVLADAEVSARFGALSTQRGFGIGITALGGALIATGFIWNALVPGAPVTVALNFNSVTFGARF